MVSPERSAWTTCVAKTAHTAHKITSIHGAREQRFARFEFAHMLTGCTTAHHVRGNDANDFRSFGGDP